MKVGAKCLAAAVLAHRDRVLSLQFNHYRKHQDDEAAQYRGFKVVFCARPLKLRSIEALRSCFVLGPF